MDETPEVAQANQRMQPTADRADNRVSFWVGVSS